VLAFDAPADALARWREVAAKSDVMDTGARRYTLSADSAREAASVRLAGATFVPALSLSADDVTQRFGAPAAVQAGGEGLQTWLYPDDVSARHRRQAHFQAAARCLPAAANRVLRFPDVVEDLSRPRVQKVTLAALVDQVASGKLLIPAGRVSISTTPCRRTERWNPIPPAARSWWSHDEVAVARSAASRMSVDRLRC
jgi:hypothetical protein